MSRVQSGKGHWAPAYPTPMPLPDRTFAVNLALLVGMGAVLVILACVIDGIIRGLSL